MKELESRPLGVEPSRDDSADWLDAVGKTRDRDAFSRTRFKGVQRKRWKKRMVA